MKTYFTIQRRESIDAWRPHPSHVRFPRTIQGFDNALLTMRQNPDTLWELWLLDFRWNRRKGYHIADSINGNEVEL